MKTASIVFLLMLFIMPPSFAELSQAERALRAEVLYKAGDNYAKDIRYKGKILRWNRAYFPIKVYLGDGNGVPNYYASSFMYATSVWQEETQGFLKFEYVNSKDKANIIYEVLDENAPDDVLAYTSNIILNDKILDKSIIYIYKKDSDGNYFDSKTIINIVVHEFGHALGLAGHNHNPTSLMYDYYSYKNAKTPPYLNGEDINTVKLLYKIVPDITNGDPKKETGNQITGRILFF